VAVGSGEDRRKGGAGLQVGRLRRDLGGELEKATNSCGYVRSGLIPSILDSLYASTRHAGPLRHSRGVHGILAARAQPSYGMLSGGRKQISPRRARPRSCQQIQSMLMLTSKLVYDPIAFYKPVLGFLQAKRPARAPSGAVEYDSRIVTST
jgi:hypothetical protein